jgi:hypothetical protein
MPTTNNYAPFKARLDGIFRQRLGSAMASGLAIAPQMESFGGLGTEWLVSNVDGRLSDHELAAVVGLDADHQRIEQGEGRVDVRLQRYDAGHIQIPDRLIEAYASQSGTDLVETRMQVLVRRLRDQHIASVHAMAAGASSTGSAGAVANATTGALNMSSPGFDLVGWARDVVAEITRGGAVDEDELRAGALGELVLGVNLAAFNAIAGLDQMLEGASVAIGSDATATRRTDAVRQDQIAARFESLTGIRLVKFSATKANGDYIWGNHGLLVVAAPAGRPGCLKTFSQSADIFRSTIRPAAGAQVDGVNVLADGFWQVAPVDGQMGRRFSVTLPS